MPSLTYRLPKDNFFNLHSSWDNPDVAFPVPVPNVCTWQSQKQRQGEQKREDRGGEGPGEEGGVHQAQ